MRQTRDFFCIAGKPLYGFGSLLLFWFVFRWRWGATWVHSSCLGNVSPVWTCMTNLMGFNERLVDEMCCWKRFPYSHMYAKMMQTVSFLFVVGVKSV